MARARLPPLNAIKAFEAAARLGSFTRAAERRAVPHGAEGGKIRLREEWLGTRLFLRTSRNAVPTRAGADLLAEAGPALDRLASASLRVQSGIARGVLHISARPTFAMRWLIPRLPELQREHPALETRILTASTPAEQFGMDIDVVVSGPARQPGWVGSRFLGEAYLPLLSPGLMKQRPLRSPADLAQHTLLHAAMRRQMWLRWLTAAGIPNLKPARDQVFEHFYFAIQAAIEGLGVAMGPLALVGDELRKGRLVAPIKEPAIRTRGYFVYAPEANSEAPAITALRQWLVNAGSLCLGARGGFPGSAAPLRRLARRHRRAPPPC